jgi:hypothetical protein
LLIVCYTRDAFTNGAATGWAQVERKYNAGDGQTLEGMYKIADGTESGATIGFDIGDATYVVYHYRGVNQVTPFGTATSGVTTNVAGGEVTAAPITIPTVTTTVADSIIFAVFAGDVTDNVPTYTYSTPTGFGNKVIIQDDYDTICAFDKVQTSIGDSGTITSNINTEGVAAFAFVINPAVSGGGGSTATPSGVSVPTAVGTPSASGSANATPSGVATAISVGTPTAVVSLNRFVSNNANYITYPTLGNVLAKTAYFKAKVYWLGTTGYLFGQAALANREFGMFINAGALYFIWGGSQCTIGTVTTLFGGGTLIDGTIEWEYNPTTGAWYFKLNGATKASGTFTAGTSRNAGTLFRIGGRDSASTSGSTAGAFFMPAGSKVSDFELKLDGVSTIKSVMPSSGTSVPGTVTGTLRSPSGTDWESYTPTPNRPIKNVVVFGASIENYCYDNSLTEPHDAGTQAVYQAGLDGVLVYGYGWQTYTMSMLLPKVALMLAAFPNPDTIFICHVAGNDVTATRPYANMTSGERTAHDNDRAALMAAFGSARDRAYFVGISFREYGNPQVTDNIFNNQELGSRPYIDQWWLSNMLSHELNVDGQPVFDYYNYTRNNRKAILNTDGIHPTTSGSPSGTSLIRGFNAGVLKSLLVDNVKPAIIVPAARTDLGAAPSGVSTSTGIGTAVATGSARALPTGVSTSISAGFVLPSAGTTSTVTLTSVNTSTGYLGADVTLGVGYVIRFPTAASLGLTGDLVNYIDVDGGIYTDFDGTQYLSVFNPTTGFTLQVELINGEVVGSTAIPAGVSVSTGVGTPAARGAARATPSGVSTLTAIGNATAAGGTSANALPAGVATSVAVGTSSAKGAAIAYPLGVSTLTLVGRAKAKGDPVEPSGDTRFVVGSYPVGVYV